MKTIKSITLFFVLLIWGLVAPPTRANLGDTETEVLVKNFGLHIDREAIDERAKVIVFTTTTGQYAVGVLDGKVESEMFTTVDDGKPDKSFVLGTLRTYREVWFPVACDEDCVASVSDDGKFFARIGEAKEIRKHNSFWIFTDAWKQFAISKKRKKDATIRI